MASSPSCASQVPLQVHLQNILTFPLAQRCSELTQIFQDAILKDLQSIFSFIVEHIFGFGNYQGWGLKLCRSQHPRDFDALKAFLAPYGPLLRLSYRLLGDGFPRYEFPVSCLPFPSRHMLEEGAVPLFYANKINFQSPGRCPSFVLLNAFEYYIFHFAYYIVNPTQQKSTSVLVNSPEFMFTGLLEDYLFYFLPADGSTVPPLPISCNPLSPSNQQTFPSSYLRGSYSNYVKNTTYMGIPPSALYRIGQPTTPLFHPQQPGVMQRSALLKPSAGNSPPSSAETTQVETWRSEVLVLTLTEFWLNQGTLEDRRGTLTSSSNTFVPSHDHVCLVRVFTKHLHFFVNNARPSQQTSEYSHPVSGLEELKCNILPQLVLKKMYTFLRLTIDHWPLDASFRLPLETWLSYIQPWRYTSLSDTRTIFHREREDRDRTVDPKWQKFVTENLLFYTVIFQKLLPRFTRMELNSPKNAYMLFRVTKVFSQPNLCTMIAEAEESLQDSSSRVLPSLTRSHVPLSLHRSSVPSHNHRIPGTLKQMIVEMESPGFTYTPLFGKEVCCQVLHLVNVVAVVKATVAGQAKAQESSNSKRSWLTDLFRFFHTNESGYGMEDYNPADNHKVELHLEASTYHLCQLFKLSQPPVSPVTLTQSSPSSSLGSPQSCSTPDCILSDNGPQLTPLGRYQMANRLRRFDIRFQGNPDLQPIRSYEIAFLVRMLWILSSFINEKFAREIHDLYSRTDLIGRVSRQLLSPPFVYYSVIKNITFESSPKQQHILPPRVSLRFLAHKQVVCYLMGLIFLGYVWGFGPITTVLLLVLVVVLFTLIKAALEPYTSSKISKEKIDISPSSS